jgi:nicotinamide riboside kinase
VRIVVVGAESTGTTTLCRGLAEHYRTRWPQLDVVPEWGREYTYIKHTELMKTMPGATVEDLVWTPEDFVAIAREQNRLEDQAAEDCRLVIADTDAWATTLWERFYLGEHSTASVEEGMRGGPRAVYLVTDHVGVPFEADGWREGEHRRAEMTGWFLEGLAHSDHAWVILRGSRHERLSAAVGIVDALLAGRLGMGTWRV